MDMPTLCREQIAVVARYSVADYDKQIAEYIATCPANLSGEARIDYMSALFLGKPYLQGALGEGPEARFDNHPLYRTDAFDCVTFVSTVLALVRAKSLDDFRTYIQQVRYHQGGVAHRFRNHFMGLDWNQQNQKQGFIENITDYFLDEKGEPVAETARAYIDKKNWYAKKQITDLKLFLPLDSIAEQQRLDELHSQSEQVSNAQNVLPYLPLSVLFDEAGRANDRLFDQMPSGMIVEIVRPNWDLVDTIGTHLNISHAGLVLRKDNHLIFRHASTTSKKVVDVSLIDYLHAYRDHATIKGIHTQIIL